MPRIICRSASASAKSCGRPPPLREPSPLAAGLSGNLRKLACMTICATRAGPHAAAHRIARALDVDLHLRRFIGAEVVDQAATEDKISGMSSTMTKLSEQAQSRAGQRWDKLEAIFEDRVAKALGKLGVPSSADMDMLAARVDALAASVAKPGKSTAATAGAKMMKTAPTRTAAKRPAAKTAAKRVVRKAA